MDIERRTFPASRLVRVRRAEDIPGTSGALYIGDRVRLNSGGPESLVVDADGEVVTVAWPDDHKGAAEATFQRPCVHLITPR